MPQKLSAIVFAFIVLFFCWFITFRLTKTKPVKLEARPQIELAADVKDIDCKLNSIPCLTDGNCLSLCSLPVYKCQNYQCKLETPSNDDCNANHGGVWVLNNLDALGKADWQCVCLYPEIFNGPSCNDKNQFVCRDGELSVNFVERVKLDSEDCICTYPKVSVLSNANNAYRAQFPICVTKNQVNNFFAD